MNYFEIIQITLLLGLSFVKAENVRHLNLNVLDCNSTFTPTFSPTLKPKNENDFSIGVMIMFISIGFFVVWFIAYSCVIFNTSKNDDGENDNIV